MRSFIAQIPLVLLAWPIAATAAPTDTASVSDDTNWAATPAAEDGDWSTTAADRSDAEDGWDDFEDGAKAEAPAFELHGFIEGLTAPRFTGTRHTGRAFAAQEARGRVDLDVRGTAPGKLRLDFVADELDRAVSIDLREAWVVAQIGSGDSPVSLKLGRQVLTWGTGDFVFLNDLFPKDWVSFLNGRADEFLKAPATAAKLSFVSGSVGLDAVWTPVFTADRFIEGERHAYFVPTVGAIAGAGRSDLVPAVRDPERSFKNGEFAARLYGQAGGVEWALYGYIGYTPLPNLGALHRLDPATNAPALYSMFRRLQVYGASLRQTLFGGIFNLEGAYHDAVDDRAGTDPFTPNSQIRGLAGFERQILAKLTGSAQYYVEHLTQHDLILRNSPFPQFEPPRTRHVVSLRLRQQLLRDNLELSLLAFVSPSDRDGYVRAHIAYRLSDRTTATIGTNVLFGADPYTFFGALRDSSNAYGRLRISF